MNNHTPTPWQAAESFSGWKIMDANGVLIAGDINNGKDMGEADAKRIVECVNACHGQTIDNVELATAHRNACMQWETTMKLLLGSDGIAEVPDIINKIKSNNDQLNKSLLDSKENTMKLLDLNYKANLMLQEMYDFLNQITQ